MEDVKAAVDDMENLYAACSWDGKLADDGANFMKAELTVKDAQDISKKMNEQPYAPPPTVVAQANLFPTEA